MPGNPTQYWTLANLIARFRSYTGVQQTSVLSDAQITSRLNDFYQTRLPVRLKPDEFHTTYRFQMIGAVQVATGDGKTTVFNGTLPATPGQCGVGFSDSVETFKEDESGALWGTYGGSGQVSGNAFSLTFATAPAYNAQIGAYFDTYTLPDDVLTVEPPIVAAGFPVSLVEDEKTFWAHWPQYQPFYLGGAAPPLYLPNIPQEVLLFDGRLTFRPVPDQAYLFESASYRKPAALSASQNVLKDLWGPFVAIETAFEYLMETGDTESATSLAEQRSEAETDAAVPIYSQLMMQRAQGKW